MRKSELYDIIDGLKSPRERTRISARRKLLGIDDPETIEELFRMIRGESDYIKVQFCHLLGEFRGDAAVLPLAVLLTSDNDKVAREAAAALDQHPGEAKDNALIQFLGRVTSRFVKYYAVRTLGRERVEKAVPYLVELLSDNDVNLRKLAVEALRLIGDPISIPHMKKALVREKDTDVLYFLIMSLGEMQGKEAARNISGFLRHGDPALRRAAVWSLARLGHHKNTNRLLKMLIEDGDENVREEIARRIVELAGSNSIEPLFRAEFLDPSQNVRVYASWALRKLPFRDKKPVLVRLAENGEEDMRAGAVTELARSDDPEVSAVLRKISMNDESENVREKARKASDHPGTG